MKKIAKFTNLTLFNLIIIFVIIAITITIGAIHIFTSHAQTNNGSSNIDFYVSGNKIMESTGRQFIPYGFVVWCLSDPNLSCNQHTSQYPVSDSDKITAAANFWHANTVRIQVAWENLFSGPGGSVNNSFLSELDSEVNLANSYHMVAIITEQTERYNGSVFPDSNSVNFWNFMASHYKNNPMVFFDLFNEPRLFPSMFIGGSDSQVWNIWQNGGTVILNSNNQSTTFVGMQTLVNTIRAVGANNIIIAEGNNKDQDLSELSTHLLSGNNIAYGTEPSLRPGGSTPDGTPAEWQSNWGNLAQSYPIMMEAFIDTPGDSSCNTNSPTLLPQLLNYLQANNLGLIYFSMDPGEAVVGYNLDQPTSFSNSTYNCSSSVNLNTNTEGPGQDILSWYIANSKPVLPMSSSSSTTTTVTSQSLHTTSSASFSPSSPNKSSKTSPLSPSVANISNGVKYNITQEGLVKAEYFLNNKLLIVITKPPFNYTLNTSHLLNGEYKYSVNLFYSSGRVIASTTYIDVHNPFSLTQLVLTAQKYNGIIIISVIAIIFFIIVYKFKIEKVLSFYRLKINKTSSKPVDLTNILQKDQSYQVNLSQEKIIQPELDNNKVRK